MRDVISLGRDRPRWRPGAVCAAVAALVALSGCGLVALPVRATSAVVKVVPVAGDVAAAPLDAAADVID